MRKTEFTLVLASILCSASVTAAQEIEFSAADGVTLFADWHLAEDDDSPIVVLFHQAGGSARGEYPEIVDHLRSRGLRVLAVDQRSGGDRFGIANRSSAAFSENPGYCEAWPDLEAALAQALERGGGAKIAVWGSSYSAGLVLRLAAAHPKEIAAALAFSPASGGPMADCSPAEAIDQITVPTIVFRPAREMEVESVREQATALEAAGIAVEVVEGGVHGSSMLVSDRSEADLEALWATIDEFLDEHLGGQLEGL